MFNDFINQEINDEQIERIIDIAILYALDFDLQTPNINDINVISVHQIIEMSAQQKIKTAKRLGYKFSFEK